MIQKVRRTRPRRTKISSKNQVTLPVTALRQAGLGVADVLEVRAQRGRIVLTRSPDHLAQAFGSMSDVWPPGALDRLRDEWEA